MRWTLSEIAAVTAGRCRRGGDTVVEGVSQDSRTVAPPMLFVPLLAERDGHDFIADAVANGAAAYLTARAPAAVAAPAVEVDDTMKALTLLGADARDRLAGVPVVGITGSVGKTTTKDLTRAALGGWGKVAASRRSFNNEIGVPITLASADADADALVIEMGSRGAGHIAHLCALARPTIGVVTTVGLVHTSEHGSLAAVTAAKQELIEALPAAGDGGVAVLNAAVPEVAAMAEATSARVVTFGRGGEIEASDIVLDDGLRPSFVLRADEGEAPVRLAVAGAHLVDNALAAAAVALAVGAMLEEVAAGLATASLSPMRMALLRAPSGARILNDCYNASPLSMRAALEALAALPAQRRIAVLGTMAELGDYKAAEHARVAEQACRLGIEIIAVDEQGYTSRGGTVQQVGDINQACSALQALGGLGGDVAVLVKGSRKAGLESLVEQLLRDSPEL